MLLLGVFFARDACSGPLRKLAGPASANLSSVAAGQRWSSEWLVCNALGGGKAQAMAAASRGQSSRGLVPWVGVAAQLSGSSQGSQAAAQGGELAAAGSGEQRRGLVLLP